MRRVPTFPVIKIFLCRHPTWPYSQNTISWVAMEHDTQGGMLHVADHHVSPGKKQWTWGNGDFGFACRTVT